MPEQVSPTVLGDMRIHMKRVARSGICHHLLPTATKGLVQLDQRQQFIALRLRKAQFSVE